MLYEFCEKLINIDANIVNQNFSFLMQFMLNLGDSKDLRNL